MFVDEKFKKSLSLIMNYLRPIDFKCYLTIQRYFVKDSLILFKCHTWKFSIFASDMSGCSSDHAQAFELPKHMLYYLNHILSL